MPKFANGGTHREGVNVLEYQKRGKSNKRTQTSKRGCHVGMSIQEVQ